MSSSDIAISVRNLGKTYRLFGHPGDRIKQFFSLGLKKYHNDFTALHDVSFDIKKGETVGIIGRNGSGKSTLLQLICGTLKPTTGTVKVNGRISALLELGAGFNPEFTGRENVYFQGAVMGLSKEALDARFDEILTFADIGEFIHQPVRTYSSGMFVRLAFSVAVHLQPDVLVVDEALSVGDERFQRKVTNYVDKIKKNGTTIMLVSHSSALIARLCEKTILLEKGLMYGFSEASRGIDRYHELLYANRGERETEGRRGAITCVLLKSRDAQTASVFESGELVCLVIEADIYEDVPEVQAGLSIVAISGVNVFGTNSGLFNRNVALAKAGTKLSFEFEVQLNLCEGSYFVSCALASTASSYGVDYIDRWQDSTAMTITDKKKLATGLANLPVLVTTSITSNK